MIQNESKVIIADNTWAKIGKVIRVLKWPYWWTASIWDKVVIAIKESDPTSNVKSWTVSWALVVRTRKEVRREDWTYIRFWDNAVVLIDKDLNAKWKRIFWPIWKEVRTKWYKNISLLAEFII